MEPSGEQMTASPLPKSVIKWAAVGLVLSSAVVIIITICSGVTLQTSQGSVT